MEISQTHQVIFYYRNFSICFRIFIITNIEETNGKMGKGIKSHKVYFITILSMLAGIYDSKCTVGRL